MTDGTLTVNGQTSNMFCLETCDVCGQISYEDLFKLSNGVTPRDDWFPASVVKHGSIPPNLPFQYVTYGPYPQITFLSPKDQLFTIYSNSASNSIVLSNCSSQLTVVPNKYGFVLKEIS